MRDKCNWGASLLNFPVLSLFNSIYTPICQVKTNPRIYVRRFLKFENFDNICILNYKVVKRNLTHTYVTHV